MNRDRGVALLVAVLVVMLGAVGFGVVVLHQQAEDIRVVADSIEDLSETDVELLGKVSRLLQNQRREFREEERASTRREDRAIGILKVILEQLGVPPEEVEMIIVVPSQGGAFQDGNGGGGNKPPPETPPPLPPPPPPMVGESGQCPPKNPHC